MNLKNKLYRLFYGINGFDFLSCVILGIYCTIILFNIFLKFNILLYFLQTILLFYLIFRIFSKNLVKRQIENVKFISLIGKQKGNLKILKRKMKEIKTHRYKKCPSCRSILRLPKKRGKHIVKCPRCGNEFAVNIIF